MCESEAIYLAADISFYHTDYLWCMLGSWSGYPYYGHSEFYEDVARIASRGVMDMLFFGDFGGDCGRIRWQPPCRRSLRCEITMA